MPNPQVIGGHSLQNHGRWFPPSSEHALPCRGTVTPLPVHTINATELYRESLPLPFSKQLSYIRLIRKHEGSMLQMRRLSLDRNYAKTLYPLTPRCVRTRPRHQLGDRKQGYESRQHTFAMKSVLVGLCSPGFGWSTGSFFRMHLRASRIHASRYGTYKLNDPTYEEKYKTNNFIKVPFNIS